MPTRGDKTSDAISVALFKEVLSELKNNYTRMSAEYESGRLGNV